MNNRIPLSSAGFKEGATLVFDKPYGWTSFQLVAKVRNLICRKFGLKKIKVGHAGTLDPLATGILIICTGKNTKIIHQYQEMEKEYVAGIMFGATTPSSDQETLVDREYPWQHITKPELEKALKHFTGEIEQIPHVFSAKKKNGIRSYEKARKGEKSELFSVKVCIKSIEIINFALPLVTLKIVCGKGTYIRSIARDLGAYLNSGAYLKKLMRSRTGHYRIENALTIEEFEKTLQQV